jgi:hypothetical protein
MSIARQNKSTPYYIEPKDTAYVTMPPLSAPDQILTIDDPSGSTKDSLVFINDRGLTGLSYIDISELEPNPPENGVMWGRDDTALGLGFNIYHDEEPLNMTPFILQYVSTNVPNENSSNITKGVIGVYEQGLTNLYGIKCYGPTILEEFEVVCDTMLTQGAWYFDVIVDGAPLVDATVRTDIQTGHSSSNEPFLRPIPIAKDSIIEVIATPEGDPDSTILSYRIRGFTKVSL